MGVCKRQALRLLARRNDQVGGRLLRPVGTKRGPSGREQASKWLVSVAVFREAMRHDDSAGRDIEAIRLEVALIGQKLDALRRAMRPLLAHFQAIGETERDTVNT